jgi:hypothetical protein
VVIDDDDDDDDDDDEASEEGEEEGAGERASFDDDMDVVVDCDRAMTDKRPTDDGSYGFRLYISGSRQDKDHGGLTYGSSSALSEQSLCMPHQVIRCAKLASLSHSDVIEQTGELSCPSKALRCLETVAREPGARSVRTLVVVVMMVMIITTATTLLLLQLLLRRRSWWLT